jgi:hypothetical protein
MLTASDKIEASFQILLIYHRRILLQIAYPSFGNWNTISLHKNSAPKTKNRFFSESGLTNYLDSIIIL